MATELADSVPDTLSEGTLILGAMIMFFLAVIVYRVQADMLERKQEEKRQKLREKMKVKVRDDWTLAGAADFFLHLREQTPKA